jgi:hypothetical protein
MNMSTDERIRAALDELAGDGPRPDLADRALAGAARRRRGTVIAAAVAILLVAAVPFALRPGASGGPGINASGGPSTIGPTHTRTTDPNAPVECRLSQEHVSTPSEWPRFVQTTLSLLPPRSDYVVEYSYSWCDVSNGDAYAEISLGPNLENGELVVGLSIHARIPLADCAAANHFFGPYNPTAKNLAFCSGGGGVPLIVGFQYFRAVGVWVQYPNGHDVSLYSAPSGPGQALPVSMEQLRAAATSPVLDAVIPDHAAPLGSSPSSPTPGSSATQPAPARS